MAIKFPHIFFKLLKGKEFMPIIYQLLIFKLHNKSNFIKCKLVEGVTMELAPELISKLTQKLK
ncbi:hypothetical protein B1B04_13815 [Lysinibacillus sp. KCTC 33748]|nr:hypothetical protein B1B04_13815 [Lysinibacillus sp. KCTC 33748]